MKPPLLVVLLSLMFAAGCASSSGRHASAGAAIMLFRADTNVRDPAANDAYPGVRRISLRALDGRTRPDAMLQLSDRLGLPVGERTLLFAAESSTGRITFSELVLRAEAGADYVAWPEVTSDHGILVKVKRGAYGETLGISVPWTPPAGAAR